MNEIIDKFDGKTFNFIDLEEMKQFDLNIEIENKKRIEKIKKCKEKNYSS